jgi:hypothetical protein
MSDPEKQADRPVAALEFPIGYKATLGVRRLAAVQNEAKTILGTDTIFVRNHISTAFVTGNCTDCLNFPTWHERAGSPRYEWSDRGDGVRTGLLVDGAAGMVGGDDPRPA